MIKPLCTVKDIFITPYWNTIHKEFILLQYSFEENADHPIYFTWAEVSDMKIEGIDSLLECVFKLNLEQFGIEKHTIPVLNFNNDKFTWLFYQLNDENKITSIQGYSESNGVVAIENNAGQLLPWNRIRYDEESTTKEFKGKSLRIIKNENAPILKPFTQKELDEYLEAQELAAKGKAIDKPISFFIAFDKNGRAIPQNNQYDLMEIYDDFSEFKDYFGATPRRNQNCFEIPYVNGKEMAFVGQYNDLMFDGFDIYCFIFYDKQTRTVAMFQQTT